MPPAVRIIKQGDHHHPTTHHPHPPPHRGKTHYLHYLKAWRPFRGTSRGCVVVWVFTGGLVVSSGGWW
jgi:hypothetical protein